MLKEGANKMKKIIACLVYGTTAVAFSGCVPANGNYYGQQGMVGYNTAGQPMSGYDIPPQAQQQMAQQQMLQQQMMQQQGAAAQGNASELASEVNVMRERVRRVERALVRLDRRMQLIERNELSRMSGSSMEGASTPEVQNGFQPMSYNQPQKLPALKPVATPQAQQANAGYQRVGYQNANVNANINDGMITSSLGVAPKAAPQPAAQQQTAFASGLPSLADDTNKAADHNVSIWTISYENGKVWPNRKQLPASRDVIESLNSGKPVALFARGASPSSREFRERVRAISKYLSKVADVDNLPIASMSADHLDKDTIELIATQ